METVLQVARDPSLEELCISTTMQAVLNRVGTSRSCAAQAGAAEPPMKEADLRLGGAAAGTVVTGLCRVGWERD